MTSNMMGKLDGCFAYLIQPSTFLFPLFPPNIKEMGLKRFSQIFVQKMVLKPSQVPASFFVHGCHLATRLTPANLTKVEMSQCQWRVQDFPGVEAQWRIQDFPEGVRQLPIIYYFAIFFAENCMKMKKIGPRGHSKCCHESNLLDRKIVSR